MSFVVPEKITLLNTQNEVKEIAVTGNENGEISVKFLGDFDAGNLEIGFTDDNTSDGVFIPATGGTFSVAGDIAYKIGRNQIVYARATGFTPVIEVKTTVIA